MKVLAGALGTLLVLAAAALIAIYSGIYNIAATNAHTGGAMEWVLHTAMKHSVRRQARKVNDPPPSAKTVTSKTARRYTEMCAQCHGAPGLPPDETGKGLMPPAPDLAKTASDWSEQELFWIIKNGVQFTGMPAWGETHGDSELWELAFLVKALPSMSADEFRALTGKATRRLHGHTH